MPVIAQDDHHAPGLTRLIQQRAKNGQIVEGPLGTTLIVLVQVVVYCVYHDADNPCLGRGDSFANILGQLVRNVRAELALVIKPWRVPALGSSQQIRMRRKPTALDIAGSTG